MWNHSPVGGPRHRNDEREEAERLVRNLALGPRASFKEITDKVAAATGLQIRLRPVPGSQMPSATGRLLKYADGTADVLFRENAALVVQRFSIFHEYGHALIGDHDECPAFDPEVSAVMEAITRGRELVSVNSRAVFHKREERVADFFATDLSRISLSSLTTGDAEALVFG